MQKNKFLKFFNLLNYKPKKKKGNTESDAIGHINTCNGLNVHASILFPTMIWLQREVFN